MNLRLVSAAEVEFAEATLFYYEESPKVASRFVDQVERAFEELRKFPRRHKVAASGIRAKVMLDFPFTIFYEILQDEVQVVAIAHHARTPEYWSGRTEH